MLMDNPSTDENGRFKDVEEPGEPFSNDDIEDDLLTDEAGSFAPSWCGEADRGGDAAGAGLVMNEGRKGSVE